MDQLRKSALHRAWRAYRGDFPPSLKYDPKQKMPNFNVVTNRCAPIVNTGRAFLFGKGVTFAMEEGATQKAKEDLDLVWRINHKGTRLRELYNNGAVCGHAFIKIVPDGIMHKGKTYPRLVILDSQKTSVETAEDDCHHVTAYNVEWMSRDQLGMYRIYRQRWERIDDQDGTEPLGAPEQWQMRVQVKKLLGDGKGGATTDDDDQASWLDQQAPQLWAYDWSPIQGCQNLVNESEYYGQPSLTPDIIALNEALNLVMSSSNKIIYHFGFPHRYGVGFDAIGITFTPDGMPILPNPDAKIEMLTPSVDLSSSRDYSKDLSGDIDEISGVPGVALGRADSIGGGKIPAATMELQFAPLLAKTDDQRELYGDLLADVNAHILELLGYEAGMEVNNVWPQSLLPRDELQDAQAAAIWTQQGVSEETLMERAGFDPDTEKERKAAEQEEAMGRMAQQQAMMGEQMSQDGDSSAPNAPGDNSDGSGGQTGDLPSKSGKAAPPSRPAQKKTAKVAAASGR